jgi:hypothetical protein
MHNHFPRAAWLLLAAAMAGCGEARPQQLDMTAPPQPAAATQFDAATASTIRGQVSWNGPLPAVPPFEIRSLVTEWNPPQPRLVRDNPHAPLVDPSTKGVAGAIVFLRGIDPRKARPWDHAKVLVEHRDRQLHIMQGNLKSRVGFVRQGDAISMVSREPAFNFLRANGAAFFALPFPDADQPLTRVLASKGIVELSSAAGWYWMRGTLFVDNHPYFTRTDAQGVFELPQVPPGRYQIVCWMPNWNQASHDRDPETSLVIRMSFHPPLELVRDVIVESNAKAQVDFTVKAELFKR